MTCWWWLQLRPKSTKPVKWQRSEFANHGSTPSSSGNNWVSSNRTGTTAKDTPSQGIHKRGLVCSRRRCKRQDPDSHEGIQTRRYIDQPRKQSCFDPAPTASSTGAKSASATLWITEFQACRYRLAVSVAWLGVVYTAPRKYKRYSAVNLLFFGWRNFWQERCYWVDQIW